MRNHKWIYRYFTTPEAEGYLHADGSFWECDGCGIRLAHMPDASFVVGWPNTVSGKPKKHDLKRLGIEYWCTLQCVKQTLEQ